MDAAWIEEAIGLLRRYAEIPAPPGQEEALAAAVQEDLARFGVESRQDAAGNVLAGSGKKFAVLAHLDEICLMVTAILPTGHVLVSPMGGFHAWKFGEGRVRLLGDSEEVPGVFGLGSVHTEWETANAVRAKAHAMQWRDGAIHTGRSDSELEAAGVHIGTRVVADDRKITDVGFLLAGRFLDDRALLAAGVLLAREARDSDAWFGFTVREEVGGQGARFALRENPVSVAIALEIGPNVPDAPVEISDAPTLWVSDSFSSPDAVLVARVMEIVPDVQLQPLTRGGSDASIAQREGLVPRGLTLAIATDNTHGLETTHRWSMARLVGATVDLLAEL
jgi:putative aminopeptidase FrvX